MPGLLDVPVAAQALQRLGRHRRTPLGRPRTSRPAPRAAETPAPASRVRRRRRPRAAAPAWSPPPTPGPGRPARCASAACRSAARRTRSRYAAWWTACATACRISAADPITQSSRVAATISMMVRTPRPSSPTRRAQVPSNSTSLEAFDRLPSLSLSRWIANDVAACRPASTRGTRKQVRPPGRLREHQEAVAHRRRTEPLVAGERRTRRRRPAARAVVVLARTSQPPCFSVMPMPKSAPAFSAAGRSPAS